MHRTVHSFEATRDDELTFGVGETIEVLSEENGGWWEGLIGLRKGWFPASHVQPHEQPPSTPPSTPPPSPPLSTRSNPSPPPTHLSNDNNNLLLPPPNDAEQQSPTTPTNPTPSLPLLPAAVYNSMVTSEKHFVDLLADTKRRYLVPLKTCDWVTPEEAKLLLQPFGAVLTAHQDFLRALAQLLSKGWDTQGPPVAELMLEHAPAISAANIQFAAVVERIQIWFEEKAEKATDDSPTALVDFIAAQSGSVAEVQVMLDAPATRVLEYSTSLDELQTTQGYVPGLFEAVPIAKAVFANTAAAVERIQNLHAAVEPAPPGLILSADVVTRGGNECSVLLYASTVVLMRRGVGGERIGSWPRTDVSACIEAAAPAVHAAITTTSMTHSYTTDQDLVTLVVPKVGSTKLRFSDADAAYTFVQELYRPALLATLGDADGWSLFAAGKPLDEQTSEPSHDVAAVAASSSSSSSVVSSVVSSAASAPAGSTSIPASSAAAAAETAEEAPTLLPASLIRPRAHTAAAAAAVVAAAPTMSPKTPRKWGKFGRRGTSDSPAVAEAALKARGGFGPEIRDIRLPTESKHLITEFTCITHYKL